MNQIRILKNTHVLLGRALEGLSDEQLTAIPQGFRNNILWNLGHMLVTQQILHYRMAGQPMLISDDLAAQFRAGTSPADWAQTPDPAELKALIGVLPDRLAEDLAAGKLANHQGFTTRSTGLELKTIEELIDFDVFHEGLHLGVIQTYRKMIA